jgi:hypothetical protein
VALTVRQRKMVKGIVAGQRPTVAAREAGYSEATATHGITKLMNAAPFRAALGRSLSRAGITDRRLWAGLDKGLDAMETKFFQHEGQVVDSRDVIAWGPRHQHLETALRLKGYLGRESADDRDDTPAPHVTIELRLGGVPLPSEPNAARRTITIQAQTASESLEQPPARGTPNP